MGRKFGWHSGKLSCKELDVESSLSLGSVDFGSVELDSILLNGRFSTSTIAGAALSLGSTYSYGEAIELRYTVTNWTGIGSSFKALYLRSEADLGGSYGIKCAEFYAVMDTSTTTGLSSLQNVYAEMLIKASASNRTLTAGHCIEANISVENQTGTLTLTNNIYCLYAKAQTGTGINDYTKVNGIRISGRDDGTARVFGIALNIVDPEATICTWTTGISLSTAATTGFLISAATTTGISITGNATDAIKIVTGTFTDALDIGTSTNGINFTGTMTRGIDFTSSTIATSTDRGKSAISIGKRASTAITKTLVASGAQHWDPVQFNVAIAGVNPDATSTMNMIYQNIAHSTTDMANLRLKGSDWTIDIQKNLQDAYVYQGEIDFSINAVAVGGEAAGIGITMSAASAVTGNVWGAVFAMSGSGLGTSAGVFISARSSAVLTHGVYLEPSSGTTITNGIYVNNAGTVTNVINFNTPTNSTNFLLTSGTGGCIGSTRATPNSTAICDGSLVVKIGTKTLLIPLYNAVTIA